MKHLLFTVYLVRVGETKEWPVSKVITEAEEEPYRDYQRSNEWHTWCDRHRFYRSARVEVVPIKGK